MMAIPTLVIAFLLVATGVGGFLFGHVDPAIGHASYTALIPAWVGLALGILGAISFSEKLRKHAMHLAAMVGLIAGLGDGFQLIQTIRKTEVAPEIRQMKLISMSVTLVLCAVFLVLCIRSFINARKNRLAGQ